MLVGYERYMDKEEADKMSAADWTVASEGCDLARFPAPLRRFVQDGKLYGGAYASFAMKEFPGAGEAMAEVERVLGVDVVGSHDHDGVPVHTFIYPDEKAEHGWAVAMGWDCARVMFGAPATPREAAEALMRLRQEVDDERAEAEDDVERANEVRDRAECEGDE